MFYAFRMWYQGLFTRAFKLIYVGTQGASELVNTIGVFANRISARRVLLSSRC